MDAPDPLSEQDLAAARAELAEGRPFPVWFTAAAVGVPVGGSAKIVSIGETAEGDFVEVRPTGTRDTVFCSPSELTRTRPPRRRAKQAPPPEPPASRPGRQQAAPARRASPKQQDAAESAAQGDLPERSATAPAAVPERKPGRARTGPGRPAEVTVTLSSSADGEWTVEVSTGRKRTVRPTPVQPAEVAKAARSLPTAVADAIESSLVAARQRQAERVERLRAELDAAQRALEDLSG
jgi:Family of unknown function (DUF6319)